MIFICFFLALGCCVWDSVSFDFTEDMKVGQERYHFDFNMTSLGLCLRGGLAKSEHSVKVVKDLNYVVVKLLSKKWESSYITAM